MLYSIEAMAKVNERVGKDWTLQSNGPSQPKEMENHQYSRSSSCIECLSIAMVLKKKVFPQMEGCLLGVIGVCLLLRRVVGKVNALLDIALEFLNGLLQKTLLLLSDSLQRVGDLLDTVGLRTVSLFLLARTLEAW
jgi:hypothetical protein